MERERAGNRASHNGGTRGAADTNVVCGGLPSRYSMGASIPLAPLRVDWLA